MRNKLKTYPILNFEEKFNTICGKFRRDTTDLNGLEINVSVPKLPLPHQRLVIFPFAISNFLSELKP